MSIWNTPNEDAKSIGADEATAGARLGFLGAIEASYDESVRYSSTFGAEVALREEEQENIQRVRRAGGKSPASLNDSEDGLLFGGMTAGLDSGAYTNYIRALNGGDDAALKSAVGDRDAALAKLRNEFPDAGIRTYDEMFKTVREKSDTARKMAQRDTTLGGAIGGFVGGMGGALDPRVNPLSVITAPFGGFGKSAVARIATEAGVQGIAEGINQVTGVRENQRMLGGSPTIGEGVLQVGGAIVAGGVLQGAVEGIGAVGRRWFRSGANDPAPPPAPIAASAPVMAPGPPRIEPVAVPVDSLRLIQDSIRQSIPGASARAGRRGPLVDFADVSARIDTWTPEAPPTALLPPMHTRMPGDATTPRFEPVRAAEETVDQRARSIDPTTFKVYDKLADRVSALRTRIDATDKLVSEAAGNAAAVEARAQIETTRARVTAAKPKQKARLQSELDELQAAYDRNFGAADTAAATNAAGLQAQARADLQKLDAEMRDLAPAVSRAYARARGDWQAAEDVRQAVEAMATSGGKELPSILPERMPDTIDVPVTVRDLVPELQSPLSRPTDGPALLEVQRVMLEQNKLGDVAIEAFRASAGRAVAEDAEEFVEFNGRQYRLDDEADMVDTGDGVYEAVTVRQMLASIEEDNQVLKAVTTCQI